MPKREYVSDKRVNVIVVDKVTSNDCCALSRNWSLRENIKVSDKVLQRWFAPPWIQSRAQSGLEHWLDLSVHPCLVEIDSLAHPQVPLAMTALASPIRDNKVFCS
jgi:hypothetical protein